MIEVNPLHHRDLSAAAELFNQFTKDLPYCWPLTTNAFRELVLFDNGQPHADLAKDPKAG